MKSRNLIELIGLIAIVGSLIFVGLQLKQSQEIAIATQYQNRAESVMELALAHLEAGYVLRRFRDNVNEDISAGDVNTFHWLWLSQDNHFFQYQAGFLDEQTWQAQFRNIREIHAICEMRFVWEWRKQGLRTDFVSLVNSLEDPC